MSHPRKTRLNRSQLFASYLDSFIPLKLNRRAAALAREALKAIEPVFAIPPHAEAAEQLTHIDDQEIALLEEAFMALRYLGRRARDPKISTPNQKLAVRSFSLVLQFALRRFNVLVPEETFNLKIEGQGSGPSPSHLGFRAALLHDPPQLGWRKVARKLIDEGLISPEYSSDIDGAAKMAEQAARPWIPARSLRKVRSS